MNFIADFFTISRSWLFSLLSIESTKLKLEDVLVYSNIAPAEANMIKIITNSLIISFM